jgi:hypothetical protein
LPITGLEYVWGRSFKEKKGILAPFVFVQKSCFCWDSVTSEREGTGHVALCAWLPTDIQVHSLFCKVCHGHLFSTLMAQRRNGSLVKSTNRETSLHPDVASFLRSSSYNQQVSCAPFSAHLIPYCCNFIYESVYWPLALAARIKSWFCGQSLTGVLCSNPAGGMDVSCECCVLSVSGLSDGLRSRTECGVSE